MAMFPLPGVVLMPGAVLPLHVFEPRYRALIEHCLKTDKTFALGTLKPGYEQQYHGSPPVYPVMGVGRIVSHQRLNDGRSNILLQSVGRVQVVHEMDLPNPFRQVSCVFADHDYAGLTHGMCAVRSLVFRVGAVAREAGAEAGRLLRLDDASLLDVLARKVLTHTRERLAYLAADEAHLRLEMVKESLAELVLQECPTAGLC
jgi:Lon protease-like protein